tara:strand:- start:713 stop:1030 length:318 start_codon:yes stop_codon:yes gene_type:complete
MDSTNRPASSKYPETACPYLFHQGKQTSNTSSGLVIVITNAAICYDQADLSTGFGEMAMKHLCLSARRVHRVSKVARTIADRADSPDILTPHVAEALQYQLRLTA